MSIVKPHPLPSPSPPPFSSSAMNSISAKFSSKLFPSSSPTFKCFFFCSQSLGAETPQKQLTPYSPSTRKTALSRNNLSSRLRAQLKEDWFTSLSCPSTSGEAPRSSNGDPQWVIGVDPDTSGALALLKTDDSGCSAQVFDSPHLKVSVGNRIRKRLDAKSIVQLLHSLNVPTGTIAYVEQSNPFPIDGKQGWWSGGFGYGLWIGILVASGISVVPVSSLAWKNKFKLSGHRSIKDVSREFASTLFPSLSPCLKRKKDHGRAEAILIASYGKGTPNVYSRTDTLNQ